MKKSITLCFMLVFALVSKAQITNFPIPQQFGSKKTITYVRGVLAADSGYVLNNRDTLNHPLNAVDGALTRFQNKIWVRDLVNTRWIVCGGTFTVGNLSPLFTSTVNNPYNNPSITYTLSNASTYTLFGRGSGSGSPSYLTSIDSNWIPSLHSAGYYDLRYAPISHTHTFQNVLTAGSTLTQDNVVNNQNNLFTFTGNGVGGTLKAVSTNGNGIALFTSGINAAAMYAENISSVSAPVWFRNASSGAANIVPIMRLQRTSYPSYTGEGLSIDWSMLADPEGNEYTASKQIVKWTDNSETPSSKYIIQLINSGVLGDVWSLESDGKARFHAYGAGSITGTATYGAAFTADGHLVEVALGGGGGGSGTVTNFSSGNLSPLFTTGVATSTSTPALSFTLSNTSAYTLFGRGSGTGVPSYLSSIDSNWIPTLHSESYYNTKYNKRLFAGAHINLRDTTISGLPWQIVEAVPTSLSVAGPLTLVSGVLGADTTVLGTKTDLASKLNLSGGTLTGHLLFTDNTYDIGASGATRPRTGYYGTSVFSPLIVGGTSTTSGLAFKTTTGNATTGADFTWLGGNNGATTLATLSAAGALTLNAGGGITTTGTGSFGNIISTASVIRTSVSGWFDWGSTNTRIYAPSNGVLQITTNSGTAQTGTLSTGGVITNYVAKTGAYTLTGNDYVVNCTSGTFTVTLPTAVGRAGQDYVIKNSGAGTITIATTSAQTIDGASTVTLSVQYGGKRIQSDGANWIIIGSF